MKTAVAQPYAEVVEQLQGRSPEAIEAFYARLRQAQDEIAKFVPPGVSLVDEFLREKRLEVEREEAEWKSAF